MNLSEIQKESFWSKVDIKNTKDCWAWCGAKKPSGYGNVRINKKYKLSHRVAFEIINGDIPDGFIVCHTCDNPSCCNPHHLMLGTTKSNAIDMVIKGRGKKAESAARGENNGNSKLTDSDVIGIRSMYSKGHGMIELAHKFGVTTATIGSIVRNHTWKHLL